AGILGPRPQQAYTAFVAPSLSYAPTDIESAMHTMNLNPPLYPSLLLKHVLHTPHIIKNLIFVHRLSIDINISISFDPFGFTVKDLYALTTSPLQQITLPSTFAAISQGFWHRRLGHPGANILHSLKNKNYISCNRTKESSLCEP
ncbi:retrovirus-related pol polyprotein from transposon TNT 1-94, partial [Tanacetum coccineum]